MSAPVDDHIQEPLKKLSPKVQSKLFEIVGFYFNDLQDVLHIATVQSNGVRPDSLTNEIYSCFHHLARGLFHKTTENDILEELDKAVGTHLKRATLDSYKIAINSILSEDLKLREMLDYLLLVEDFEKYIPDGHEKIEIIKNLGREVRDEYKNAKYHEALGLLDPALDSYNISLDKSLELQTKIRVFTTDKIYLLACAREARERKEKQKDRRSVILAAIIASVLTAFFTLGGPALFEYLKPSNSNNAAINNSTQAPQEKNI